MAATTDNIVSLKHSNMVIKSRPRSNSNPIRASWEFSAYDQVSPSASQGLEILMWLIDLLLASLDMAEQRLRRKAEKEKKKDIVLDPSLRSSANAAGVRML